jgi:hypothetical protein
VLTCRPSLNEIVCFVQLGRCEHRVKVVNLVHGRSDASVGGKTPQYVRNYVVALHASASSVHAPQVDLGLRDSMFGSFSIPARGADFIARYASSGLIDYAQGKLATGAALLG